MGKRRGVTMLANFEKMAIAGLLCILSTTADAQSIRPECMKFRDKIGCTCALNNGGEISANGLHWYSVIGRPTSRGGQTNQAFTNCNKRLRGA